MKKTIIWFSFLLLLSLMLTWCNKQNDNSEWIIQTWNQEETQLSDTQETQETIKQQEWPKKWIYENKTEKFSLEFPDGREFEENKYGFDTIIFTPKNDDIKENIWVSTQELQKFLSVDEYYQETVNKLNETQKGFEEIDSKNIIIDDLNWKYITYKYQEGENELKIKQVFLISSENKVYTINYTATKDTFDDYIQNVDQIINSFQIQ